MIRKEGEPALVFLVLLVLGAGQGLVCNWVGEKKRKGKRKETSGQLKFDLDRSSDLTTN